jgi:hypothetical protein
MTALARLWPDPYTAAVVRKYSPGMLAELAAWMLTFAARLADVLVPIVAVPIVRFLTAVVVTPDGPAVAWSAPAGADSMTTGPPCAPREAPYGAGRT